MRADPRPVVVGEETVARPESDRLASRRAHSPGDQVERLVPTGLAPLMLRPARADQRLQEAPRVADDLSRGLAPDAEKAAAVRVVGVPADLDETIVLDLDEHAAQGRMTAHRAHGPDHSPLTHHFSSSHLQRGHRSWPGPPPMALQPLPECVAIPRRQASAGYTCHEQKSEHRVETSRPYPKQPRQTHHDTEQEPAAESNAFL